MKRLVTVVVILAAATPSFAEEIGPIEDFALAQDRSVPLAQMIPGTQRYFYYHALHHQNTGQYDKVDELLPKWIAKHNVTDQVREIRHRQALLKYEQNPQETLAYLREQLGLKFDHQRQVPGETPDLPTSLDQQLISGKAFTERALNELVSFDAFSDSALDWLIDEPLLVTQRRAILSRLKRPDYANLAEYVVRDLKLAGNKGFGSLPIHKQLLPAQLEECLKRKPELLNESAFVSTYLKKLRPAADVDWQHNPQARAAHLDRLWGFVRRLSPVHNSLKAHVLYHRLVLDRSQGVFDRERFLTYVKLPRQADYVNAGFLEFDDNRRHPAHLNTDYEPLTLLPAVVHDEPLVHSYLQHFFIDDHNYLAFSPFLEAGYVKGNFEEAKLVNFRDDPPALDDPFINIQLFKEIQQRVDLEFAPTNKQVFASDEPVTLEMDVKNVRNLIVKVFEINTRNFYRQERTEVDAGIELDGLVANEEFVYTYDEPPWRRVRRQFEFPSLAKPGVYVIDFIGNGKHGRALIRKGRLRYLMRISTAGHVFTVLDDRNRLVPGASIFLAGHEYRSGDDDTIAVPFSTNTERRPIVLAGGGICSLDHFLHRKEAYSLTAAMYVDRESLLSGETAKLLVRPALYLNGTPVTLSVLEDVRLTITSTNHDKISITKEVPDFKLFEDRESVYEFQVPDRLQRIQFAIQAKVPILSQNKQVDVSSSKSFGLNYIDTWAHHKCVHLAKIDGCYVLDLLGKTGEPRPNKPLEVTLTHRDFTFNAICSLRTDRKGRIELGELRGIKRIKVVGQDLPECRWQLRADTHRFPSTVHGRAGQTIEIPYMGRQEQPTRAEFSLLELRGETFVADRFDAISLKDGLLRLNKLPPGDYDLLLKRNGQRIRVRVAEGQQRHGYVLGKMRHLEIRDSRPLQIVAVDTTDETVTVRLKNASKFARVHVFATRYYPAYSAVKHLGGISQPGPWSFTSPAPESSYLTARRLGDEQRYIIDRKYAKKYPGNMLRRPGLLLNPWALDETDESVDLLSEIGDYTGTGLSGRGSMARQGGGNAASDGDNVLPNLDFLAQGSAVLVNLVPDKEGLVTIRRQQLGPHQQVHVVAIDPRNTVYRTVSLPETKSQPRDLRLADGLDPAVHFTQHKQIRVLKKGDVLVLAGAGSSNDEVYDCLPKVHTLLTTLSNDPALAEFAFILDWPRMTDDDKRAMYSKYACHELSFFVYKKDPKFFQQVVQPYLRNKKDKTFLDHWLLDDDLKAYLAPWAHGQLNTVEQILLAQRIAGQQPHTSRHVSDLFDLIPPDVERRAQLFDTAIRLTSLDTGNRLGRDRAASPKKPPARPSSEKTKKSMDADPFGDSSDDPFGGGDESTGEPGDDPFGSDGTAGQESKEKEIAVSDKTREALSEKLDVGGVAGEDVDRLRERSGEETTYFESDGDRREATRQLYQGLDDTQQWLENNYYHLPIEEQTADLITVNAFWRDYANTPPGTAFLSPHLAETAGNFSEMMFALSLLDLPFEPGEHETKTDGDKTTFTAGGPAVIFQQELAPTEAAAENTPVLVSQDFFRRDDRHRQVGHEKRDKFVTEEFLIHTVYGCQIVVTNPTSSRQRLDLLLQLPVGSMPVLRSKPTRSVHVDLDPHSTHTTEYFFYFPAAGDFAYYPVQVSQNERLVAGAAPFRFHVVERPTRVDRDSWLYVSQHGTNDEVLAFLKSHNVRRLDLDRIAFRMADKGFFGKVTTYLAARHVYHPTLWSYGIRHNVATAIREYLQHADEFVNLCGPWLDSPLLTVDPVARKAYQHVEFSPLVNARAHQLGPRRQIANDKLSAQYHELLSILSHRPQLSDDDLMSVTYYLLLQDRIEEAFDFFGRVDPEKLATRLQYDYFTAYLDFYTDDRRRARKIALRYADYPIDRWRQAFAQMVAQLDEADDGDSQVTDAESRTQRQTHLAASQPSFDFQIDSREILVNYQNLARVTVNYYLMDIEMLFSQNPFVQRHSGRFSHIRPTSTQKVELPAEETSFTLPLPEQFHNSNVLVEIAGGGQTKSQASYSNSMSVQVIENYGQLRVTHAETGRPLPQVYVKVYARTQDGEVQFYKDGYSDLRGRFDYTSLSTGDMDPVAKFALLILSDEHGAAVRETEPPAK